MQHYCGSLLGPQIWLQEGGGLELIVYYLPLSLCIDRKKSLLSFIATIHYLYFFVCSLILIYLTSQHCSKNAWDSSGGSQALGSIQSSLPQGTKDYLADAQNKVFNRKNLRSPTVFFGLGEEKPFYLERVPSLITERVKHNLSFFYLNYALLTALLFCLTLLISPSAIIGIGLLGFAWMAVIRATAEGSVQIKGESNKFFFITSIHNSSIFSHPLFATYLQELPLLKNKQQ